MVEKIPYFDHYEFKQSDIEKLKEALIDNDAEIIVTTEKDMIRFLAALLLLIMSTSIATGDGLKKIEILEAFFYPL